MSSSPRALEGSDFAATQKRTYQFLSVPRSGLPVLVLTIACLLVAAWLLRSIQDDAFISFRYAANLVEGNGLVWNAGEYVEGYANFLRKLYVALLLSIGVDPILGSQITGVILFGCTLYLTYALARNSELDESYSLAAMVITGTNFTVLAYATGGLETQSVATLVILQTVLAVRYTSTGRQLYLWGWSIASGLALMSRLDTALLLLPVGLSLLYQIIFHNKS